MLRVIPLSRPLHHQTCFFNRVSSIDFQPIRHASDFSKIGTDLTSRRLPLLYDDCSSLSSHLLLTTLSDFLPIFPYGYSDIVSTSDLRLPRMHFAHHLVYFPPPTSHSSLFPDGTDPLHSPGSPFTRRMWAGGVIKLPPKSLKLNEAPAYCQERIRNVIVKGSEGAEKVYVQIERHLHQTHLARFGGNAELLEQKLSGVENDDFVELRNLVFMRKSFRKEFPDTIKTPAKSLKPLHSPDISHVLVPTAALLFRFSALTFNAHAIHLDKRYCQEVEGYRNLLVHGPLSLLFMTELLRGHLASNAFRASKIELTEKTEPWGGWGAEYIEEIEYRNLAPLYADEEMKVCGRRKKEDAWELWIEGKDGRLAVRGLAKTRILKKTEANKIC